MSVCEDVDDPYSFKENTKPFMKSEDLSMYDSNTNALPFHCLENTHDHCSHGPIRQRSLDLHDTTSQDSGFGLERIASFNSPTKLSSFETNSLFSMEDEFLDLADVEPKDKPTLPKDFNKLIAGPIRLSPKIIDKENTPSPNIKTIRPLFKRALSLQNDNTPVSRVRTMLFKVGDDLRSFKRPEPSSLESSFEGTIVKRSKVFQEEIDEQDDAAVPTFRPTLKRAFSSTDESIMCAVQRSDSEPDLIGDFSRQYGLPLATSRHQDLKAISPSTLFELMHGDFGDTISSFKVIDCRYPYEFDGGHIEGAVNIYTRDQCLQLLDESELSTENSKRHILVFHCEFSSERGPNL